MNLKTRFEELEIDYADQLTNKEKEWLNSFNEGFVNSDFRDAKTRKIFRDAKKNTQVYVKKDDLMSYYDKLTDEQKNMPEIIARKKAIEDAKLLEEKTNKSKVALLNESKRESYNRNNARNRCILTRAKASGNAESLDEIDDLLEEEQEVEIILPEDL